MIIISDLQERMGIVRKMLMRLRPMRNGHRIPVSAHRTESMREGHVVLSAADNTSAQSYRDWLFRTRISSVFAYYAERWLEDGIESLKLYDMAFHLYLIRGGSDREELFAFHCEPTAAGSTVAERCKRGPHFHVSAGRSMLSHAHIPFCYTNLDSTLESTHRFTEAIQHAIDVIDQEIVTQIAEALH